MTHVKVFVVLKDLQIEKYPVLQKCVFTRFWGVFDMAVAG